MKNNLGLESLTSSGVVARSVDTSRNESLYLNLFLLCYPSFPLFTNHMFFSSQRGVGEKAVGTSISLVAPAEGKEHQKICEAVRGIGSKSLEQVHIDGRLLNEAVERVTLATKIVSCNDVETQASRNNKWVQDAAKEAGLDVDEDMMEGGLLDGDQRDRQRFLEAKRAKGELRQLLAKPI
jgi:hypothetical protein